MRKSKRKKPEEVMILIGYKDTPENRQALRMAAAKEGHGSVSALIRKAVIAYLKKNHPKELLAGTG